MIWKQLINKEPKHFIAPWVQGRRLDLKGGRSFRLIDKLWVEPSWCSFEVVGPRHARIVEAVDPVFNWPNWATVSTGYLAGDRFLPVEGMHNAASKGWEALFDCPKVWILPPNLEPFARVQVGQASEGGPYFFAEETFPEFCDDAVRRAQEDGLKDLDHLKGVPAGLAQAFEFTLRYAQEREARRKAAEEKREKKRAETEAKAKLEQLMSRNTAVGRRALAATNFETAARMALEASGCELLSHRDSFNRGEKIVRFKIPQLKRRFEAVVSGTTLQILDSGICLTDHDDGDRDDSQLLTLESLPGVILEADRLGKLVVWRHV